MSRNGPDPDATSPEIQYVQVHATQPDMGGVIGQA
jgi:hypothetical protein